MYIFSTLLVLFRANNYDRLLVFFKTSVDFSSLYLKRQNLGEYSKMLAPELYSITVDNAFLSNLDNASILVTKYTVSKKLPTFKLSVTSSNLNRF